MGKMDKPLPERPLPSIASDNLKIDIPEGQDFVASSPLYDYLLVNGSSSDSSFDDTLDKVPTPPARKSSAANTSLSVIPRGSNASQLPTPISGGPQTKDTSSDERHERSMATLEEYEGEEEEEEDEFDLPPPNYIPASPVPVKKANMRKKVKAKNPRPGHIAVRIRLDGTRVFKLNIDQNMTLKEFRGELARRIKLVTGVDVSDLVSGCSLYCYDGRDDRIRILDEADWVVCKRDNRTRGLKMEMVSKFAKITKSIF